MKNATEKGDRGAASLRESGDLRDKERKLVFRHAENRKSFPANRTAHSLGPAVQTAKRLKGDTETAGKDGVILLVQEEQHETLFFRVRQCTTTFHLRDGDTKQHTAVAFFIVPQEREKRNTKRCNGREGVSGVEEELEELEETVDAMRKEMIRLRWKAEALETAVAVLAGLAGAFLVTAVRLLLR